MSIKSPVILAVDDEPNSVKLLRINFAARGFQVVTASSGAEAIKAVQDQDVDLVLLDIMLPDISGFQVCRQLRRTSQIPIIMLSARTSDSDKADALSAGANGFITKPFGIDDLISVVQDALQQRSRASDEGD